MKTYTFFYYDTDDIDNIESKKYAISSPRFDFAFKSFSNFILLHESDYINFFYTYNVSNGNKTQVRSLSFSDIVYLSGMRDKHNNKGV